MPDRGAPRGSADRAGSGGLERRVLSFRTRGLLPALGSGLLSVGSGIGLMTTSGWLIVRASLRPPVFVLAVAIGAVQAFSLGRGLARYLQRLSAHDVSLSVLTGLRVKLFDELEPRVPGGLEGRSAGSIVSGFLSDTERVADGVATAITGVTEVVASVVVGTVVAFLAQPEAGVVLGAGALGCLAVTSLMCRLGRSAAQREATLRAELADVVVETIRAAPELIAYGREDLVATRLADVRRRSDAAGHRRALAVGLGRAAGAWSAIAALIAVAIVALHARATHRLSGVMLSVIVFDALAVFDYLATLPALFSTTTVSRAAGARLRALAALEVPGSGTPPGSERPRADARRRGSTAGTSATDRETSMAPRVPSSAALEDVCTESRGRSILRGVSFDVTAHARVALVGPSGSGKTSALHCLLGFVACSDGVASLGGNDVRELSRHEIAARAGWLADETHLFAASLRDNLRIADRAASDVRCAAVIRQVGLESWFELLPHGLATVLGTGGLAVSAGERQRIGLARALLSDADLLLLDEPTSHLDPESAVPTLTEMLDASQRRSVLVVSHDMDIADHVDATVVIDDGRVVSASSRTVPAGGVEP
jgi:thiol reductant ABC exporter CydC subunit